MSASPAKKPATSAPAKDKAAASKPKHPALTHPTYAEMIKSAIQNLKEPKGSSKAAILKYIVSNYKVGDNIRQINSHIRMALVRGVESNNLKQVKGHGASGSFRLGEAAKKKTAAPKKRPVAPKPKKPTTAAAKTAKPKKTVKPKKTKSPAKPKAKKAAASPKKPKSPVKKPATPASVKKVKSPAKKAAVPAKKKVAGQNKKVTVAKK